MKITETTLRGIIKDYIYHRPEYKKEMLWRSNFHSDEILVILETKPHSQESLGFHLIEEGK